MILELLRVIVGLILILFIPGYALTWAFFPKKQDISSAERIALSFALSIAGVMLSVLFIDLVLGVDTTPLNIVITIIALTLLSLLAWRMHLYIINKKLKNKIIKWFFGSIEKIKDKIKPSLRLFYRRPLSTLRSPHKKKIERKTRVNDSRPAASKGDSVSLTLRKVQETKFPKSSGAREKKKIKKKRKGGSKKQNLILKTPRAGA